MSRISALQRTHKPYRNQPLTSRMSSRELKDIGLMKHEVSADTGWHIDMLFSTPHDFN